MLNYNDKTELLLKNRIGLWDVLHSANRNGSLDSNIQNEELNDFKQLFETFPQIKVIIFNGKKAADYFSWKEKHNSKLKYFILPSTSSANTRKSLETKMNEWHTALIKTVNV